MSKVSTLHKLIAISWDGKMSFFSAASGSALWRGYEYFRDARVLLWQQTDTNTLQGKVRGSGEKIYTVSVNLEHPRASQCDCPHAAGRKIVCKHMAAVYFAAFPQEMERYLALVEEGERQQERRWEEQRQEVWQYVNSLTKQQLKEQLYQALQEKWGQW